MKAIVTTSANPLHYGHMSLYNESVKIFGKGNVKITIGKNANKNIDFGRILFHIKPYGVDYEIAENITLSDYCKNNNIDYIVRGIRNAVDAEYELKLDFLNKEINCDIQTKRIDKNNIFLVFDLMLLFNKIPTKQNSIIASINFGINITKNS